VDTGSRGAVTGSKPVETNARETPDHSPARRAPGACGRLRAMAIFDQVNEQMKAALKAGEKLRLQALRNIRAAFLLRLKEDASQTSISDEDCVPILRKLEKQRRESIEAFDAAGRHEQAAAERAELEVVLGFLPALADEATVRAWVEAAIAESGASTQADVGRVMGALMKAHKGEVDGNTARRVALELLGG